MFTIATIVLLCSTAAATPPLVVNASKRESRHDMNDCRISRSQPRCWLHPARRATYDRTKAHRRLDQSRDDLCAGGLRKHAWDKNCYFPPVTVYPSALKSSANSISIW